LNPSVRQPKELRRGNGEGTRSAIRAAAPRCQAAALIPVVVEFDRRDRFADHERVAGNDDVVLERLPEPPGLLVVAVGIDRDRFDDRVEHGRGLVIAVSLLHGSSV
jgi:hypothetical protein